ncbi:DUF397 domain-containing protein [Spirillospora sp. CA-255316]
MRNFDDPMAAWRKSRRCEKEEACVEVAALSRDTIGVRDSVDGPVLRLPGPAWRAFSADVAAGRHDLPDPTGHCPRAGR